MTEKHPVPTNKTRWSHLDQMKVGDCEFDPDGTSTSAAGSALYAAMVRRGTKHGWKVTGRKVDGGVRVWRIS